MNGLIPIRVVSLKELKEMYPNPDEPRPFRYSAISCSYRCLKKYELEYIKGQRPPIKSSNMEFGTALHLGLSAYLESKDYDHALQSFNMFWNTCKDLDFKRDDWKALKDKGEVFLSRFVRLHAKKYEPAFIEHQMDFLVGNYHFSGTPDYVGLYEGVPSIVDFKTAHARYDKRKIIVNEQMPLYAHAAQQQLGYTAEQLVYVVFVKNPEPSIQVLTRKITQDDVKKALDNVIAVCDDLSSRDTFPMNRDNCTTCDHYTTCYGGD